MGVSLSGLGDWFKKRADEAANGAAAGYHGVNVFDGGQGFTTRHVQQAPGQRTAFQRGVDQFNQFDNGRTWKNAVPQNDRSVFGQMAHNGLTNTAGNMVVKPVANTGLSIWDLGKTWGDQIAGAPMQQQLQDANNLESHWHGSIPGFLTDQALNAGKAVINVPRAVQGNVMGGSLVPHSGNGFVDQAGFAASNPLGFAMDKMGHHPHGPTAEQQAAYQHGLQGLNGTVVGQMVSPVEGLVGDHAGEDIKNALRQGGYDVDATGAQKYFANPVMGAVGTYGFVKGGADVARNTHTALVERPMQTAQNVVIKQILDEANGAKPSPIKVPQQADAAPMPGPTIKVPGSQKSAAQTNPPLIEDGAPQAAPSGIKIQNSSTPQSGFPSTLQDRSFTQTIIEDAHTAPKVKAALQDLDNTYMSRNTKALQMKAANLVKDHRDIAEQMSRNATDDISVAVGSELIKTLQKEGNYTAAVDVAGSLAKNLTDAGRMVQAASIYGKLTPEGILRFAQNEINKYNEATGKKIQLNPTDAQRLTKMAEDINKMAEGPEKNAAAAKLVSEVHQTMPATLAAKLSTLQTMAQLLNPKTNIRNVGGNTIFAGMEGISQTLGTGLDKGITAIRRAAGNENAVRTTGLPNIKIQLQGIKNGGATAVKEAFQGYSTGPKTQFELSEVPVFRGRILGNLEKTMNATLRGADRAAYEAAFDDSLANSMRLNKVSKPTAAMIEQAHQTGLYRTFQDTNRVSSVFTGIKKGLNNIGIGNDVTGKFGLGDIILKYPKNSRKPIGARH
jgi:hypothetical protein